MTKNKLVNLGDYLYFILMGCMGFVIMGIGASFVFLAVDTLSGQILYWWLLMDLYVATAGLFLYLRLERDLGSDEE